MGSWRMIWLLVLGAMALLPGPCPAQVGGMAPGSKPGAAGGESYVLDGMVVNALTGEPIRRALVQGPNGGQLTGADGKFHFEQLPPGQYGFSVRKPGYFSEQDISQGGLRNNAIQVGSNTPPLVLKLTPESIIYGRITRADGEPIENLPVRLYVSQVANGHRQWQQRGGQSTDENGEFRIADLRPATYFLRAGPAFQALARTGNPQGRAEGYASTFYPGARELDSAAPIKLEAGQQYRAEFAMQTVPVYQVTGTVSGITPGMNGVGLQLFGRDGEPLPFGGSVDRTTGRFTMQMVPTGTYTLNASALDTVTREEYMGRALVTVSGDIAGAGVMLVPSSSIPVTVRYESTGNLPQYQSAPGNRRPPVMIQLIPQEGGLANYPVSSTSEGPPENRKLSLRNVRPGTYRAEIPPMGPWYVSAARSGSVDLLREELTVPEGGSVEPIEVVLRDDAASLSGKVTSGGQPTTGVVLLVPVFAPRLTKQSFVQPDGNFFFAGLAPGEYRIIALDRVDDLLYAEPDGLAEFSAAMQALQVSPNQQATQNLELVRRQK
jgi:hypothetical protein